MCVCVCGYLLRISYPLSRRYYRITVYPPLYESREMVGATGHTRAQCTHTSYTTNNIILYCVEEQSISIHTLHIAPYNNIIYLHHCTCFERAFPSWRARRYNVMQQCGDLPFWKRETFPGGHHDVPKKYCVTYNVILFLYCKSRQFRFYFLKGSVSSQPLQQKQQNRLLGSSTNSCLR